MRPSAIREVIKTILEKHQIDAFGYCSADDFDEAGIDYDKKIASGLACELERRSSVEALVEPGRILTNAQSFLCLLLPYSPYVYEKKIRHGRLASGTASEDYHTILNRILNDVKDYLMTEGIDSEIIVDTTPLSDRAIAQRAGLGLIRRNNMIYHKKYGSYVHIGSLLMNEDLHEHDTIRITDPCGHCRRCVGHCPGGAIVGDGTINSNKCVSYLTQKKELSNEEALVMGDMIYGCNVCQEVCPVNKGILKEAQELLVDQEVNLTQLLDISNSAFRVTYGLTASGWRGKRTLQRNAINVLGNTGTNRDKLILEKCLKDPRPIIQEAAQDAMKRIDFNKID